MVLFVPACRGSTFFLHFICLWFCILHCNLSLFIPIKSRDFGSNTIAFATASSPSNFGSVDLGGVSDEALSKAIRFHNMCRSFQLNFSLPQEVQVSATPLPPPPLLLSFPGSGNTWVRLLIETLTGRATGSLHQDDQLDEIFRLQSACDKRVSAIKAHPAGVYYNETSTFFQPREKSCRARCLTGGIAQFEKVIFIARHMVDATWAMFHLLTTGSHNANFGAFPLDRYEKARKFFVSSAIQSESEWVNSVYPFIVRHPDSFLVLNFESLISPSRRLSELMKVCDFLGNCPEDVETHARCAFVLSDRPEAHRSPDMNRTTGERMDYLQLVMKKYPALACNVHTFSKTFNGNFSYLPHGKKPGELDPSALC